MFISSAVGRLLQSGVPHGLTLCCAAPAVLRFTSTHRVCVNETEELQLKLLSESEAGGMCPGLSPAPQCERFGVLCAPDGCAGSHTEGSVMPRNSVSILGRSGAGSEGAGPWH